MSRKINQFINHISNKTNQILRSNLSAQILYVEKFSLPVLHRRVCNTSSERFHPPGMYRGSYRKFSCRCLTEVLVCIYTEISL